MQVFVRFLVVLGILTMAVSVRADEPAKKDDAKKDAAEKVETKLAVDQQAPAFKITCGCSGCDKELAYFQELHEAYKSKGLVSLAIFKEPDAKVEDYVKQKKLNMLYAVDTKGDSWNVWQTKSMPTNFLIDRGGRIAAIAAGCDTTGLLAKKLSEKAAGLVGADAVDVKASVEQKAKGEAKQEKK
jgi:thiol-disulfide isomerase/thioredoxin